MDQRVRVNAVILVLLIILSSIALFLSSTDSSDTPDPEVDFTLSDAVDPHVRALADAIRVNGDVADVLAWPSERLIPQDYEGAMRSPGAVMAGQMANDLDRCRMVRELLTAVDIPSRYALDGESCWIEAKVDGAAVWIPTSRFDDESSLEMDGLTRALEFPSDRLHTLAFVEVLDSATEGAGNMLLEGPMADLCRGPTVAAYVDDGGAERLSMRFGLGDDQINVVGEDVSTASRHDLIIRHTRPDGTSTEHRRTLFDATASVGNQAPDADADIYGIWMGTHVVGEPYLDVEHDRLEGEVGEMNAGSSLYLRAAELALQTDRSADRLYEENELSGAFVYDELRIVIAALETRTAGVDGQTPSFDILANPRSVIGADDAPSIQVAFGWSDALTEAALFQQITGVPALTTPSVFEALFRQDPAGVSSRMAAMDSALDRLRFEGVTEEGLIFYDSLIGHSAEVVKISSDIVLLLDDDQFDALSTGEGDALEALTPVDGGLVLEAGAGHSWPIELLMLEQGASLDYSLSIQHVESAQGALSTPEGTLVAGTGTYFGENMSFSALVRSFETIPDGETTARDRVDWHLVNDTGELMSSGMKGHETPPVDSRTRDARLLVLGSRLNGVTGDFVSPLWLHPSLAETIRGEDVTAMRISYAVPGDASSWHSVTLDMFETGHQSMEVDGKTVEVRTVTGRDVAGEYAVTLAEEGATRLVLALETPVSSSVVTSLRTPGELRLRGQVLSTNPIFTVGLEDARIHDDDGQIGRAWPDGSIDIRVPGTAQATLGASVALLVDSSYSMDAYADLDCTSDCESRFDVVKDALATIAVEAPRGIELGVWAFENYYPGTGDCLAESNEVSGWTLSRNDTREGVEGMGLSSGTPLTGAVGAAISNFESGTWGHEHRLIVLADGDNACPNGLDTLDIPAGLKIHTIGVGIAEGSDAEMELAALANRAGGTYTRTNGSTDLTGTLTSLATSSIPEPSPEVVEVEVRAEEYITMNFSFPVDQDNVTIVLESEEGRDAPSLIAVMPGDVLPDLQDAATTAIITERREVRPNHVFIMPYQEVDSGGLPLAYAWLEIDPESGETAALTLDGLHGSAVFYYGAWITGMWSGADSVIFNFGGCILTSDGCGDNMAEIRQNLCEAASPDAENTLEYLKYIGDLFSGVDGDKLEARFNDGMELVQALCKGEAYFTQFLWDEAGSHIEGQYGGAAGNAWGYLGSALISG